jgi:hypothetical protein
VGASSYEVRIVERATGKVVAAFPPGLEAEQSLVRRLTERICHGLEETTVARSVIEDILGRVEALGVGLGRTQAHVLADVEKALVDHWAAGHGLHPDRVERAVAASVNGLFHDVKSLV